MINTTLVVLVEQGNISRRSTDIIGLQTYFIKLILFFRVSDSSGALNIDKVKEGDITLDDFAAEVSFNSLVTQHSVV